MVEDFGIPLRDLQIEKRIHDTFTIDIVYKDFAIEIDGPFHFIHDPLFFTDPEFATRKQSFMYDFNA